MNLFRGLRRRYLAGGAPPHLVGEPFQPLLRVVELRRRHLLRPAGDLACVAEQVVQHLPPRPVLGTLGAGPRSRAVWIASGRSGAVLYSCAASRTVGTSLRSATSVLIHGRAL